MTTLTTNDIGAGVGAALNSGKFRSNGPQHKSAAFYRDALTKQFGTAGDMPGGEGMIRIMAGKNFDKQDTILIRNGDSGERIVGVQVSMKPEDKS
jgi:hypothetical protein